MEIVQNWVYIALRTYEEAICSEFAKSAVEAQVQKDSLLHELKKAGMEIQENAQVQVLQLAHNIALDHGLVRMNAENVAELVKAQMEIEKKALEEAILQKVSQTLKPELQSYVDLRIQGIKDWVSSNLTNFARRVEDFGQKAVNVESFVNSHIQKYADFREKVSIHAQAINFGMSNCVQGFQRLSKSLANAPSGLGINSLREELSKVVRECASGAVENANREGRLDEKVQTLEKRMEGVQQQVVSSLSRDPKVVLVPPSVVQIPMPHPAATPFGSTAIPPAITPVLQPPPPPKEEILKWVPLEVEGGGGPLNLLSIQEALLECAGGLGGGGIVPEGALQWRYAPWKFAPHKMG